MKITNILFRVIILTCMIFIPYFISTIFFNIALSPKLPTSLNLMFVWITGFAVILGTLLSIVIFIAIINWIITGKFSFSNNSFFK